MSQSEVKKVQRRRRVVALSALDQARVARGQLPEAEAEALRRQHTDALSEAHWREDQPGLASNDARLAREVPPHWGNGR